MKIFNPWHIYILFKSYKGMTKDFDDIEPDCMPAFLDASKDLVLEGYINWNYTLTEKGSRLLYEGIA